MVKKFKHQFLLFLIAIITTAIFPVSSILAAETPVDQVPIPTSAQSSSQLTATQVASPAVETTVTSSNSVTTEAAQKAATFQATEPVQTTEIPLPEALNDPTFEKDGSRFTLTILPDTQFYSRYGTEASGNQYAKYGENPFNSQTQWIADNDEAYNDRMTLHLGDVVDQSKKSDQWAVADKAMKILEDNQHPYSILAGNHDILHGYGYFKDPDTGEEYRWGYQETFPEYRARLNDTFQERESSTQSHEFHKFNVDGQDFINIALSWDVLDGSFENALTWAENILKANPNTPTIITSHQLLNIDTATNKALDTDFGNLVWDRLINPYNQVFLTYNGHHHGATHRLKNNQFNKPVIQVLTDHQMAYMGGNGYMVMAEFDLTNNKIHHTTFSPWVLDKQNDLLTSYDKALITDPGATFTYDFDFLNRFPQLKIGPTTHESYTQKLRQTILSSYTEPEVIALTPAENKNDYVVVDNTVAHWRMSEGRETMTDGTELPVGSQIIDIAVPENTMVRVPGTGPVAANDVIFSKDHSAYSSDAGSIVFNNVSKNAAYPDGSTGVKAHLFSTSLVAPINLEEFKEGYTFETFVKINPEFSTDNNAWMRWLARAGARHDYKAYDINQGDEQEPLFQWAMSNLKEIQFSLADASEQSTGNSAWSGEITNLGQWIHLAAVNNPLDRTITLYVDGQPVLRNVIDQLGIGSVGLPWLIGGDYDYYNGGTPGNGFLGAIGETRLVKGVVAANQWLTARTAKEEPIIVEPTDPTEPTVTTEETTKPEESSEPVESTEATESTPKLKTETKQAQVAVNDKKLPKVDKASTLPATGEGETKTYTFFAITLILAGLAIALIEKAHSNN